MSSACSLTASGDADEGPEGGQPSGAVCPDDSTLDYENFGRGFMTSYCVRCHDSALSGSERRGAPSDHDFDSLTAIRATDLSHLDTEAAAGPLRINTNMPDTGDEPSLDERLLLGEWLACGAP